jgi:hypothetical protein
MFSLKILEKRYYKINFTIVRTYVRICLSNFSNLCEYSL